MRQLLRPFLPPAVVLVAMLAAWELLVRLLRIEPFQVPAPSAIWQAAREHSGPLARGLALTARAALGGFALSAVAGVLIAVVLSSSRWVQRAFYPFTVFLQTVPLVAIAPLLVFWFGYGLRPVIVAAFIVSLFPVIANTMLGLRSVDPALRDLFRLYGASPAARLIKLRLPSALPAIFAGYRVAAGLSVIGAIVGEFFGSYAGDDVGLGLLVKSSVDQFRTELVFAAVILASLLGLALFGAVNLASYLLLRHWHASEQQ